MRPVASNHAYLPNHPSVTAYYSLSMAIELWPEISTRTLFIAGQSLQGSHSQLGITVNSFRSHTGCFTLLIQSEIRWLQRSHGFLYEGSAVLRNGDCACVRLYTTLYLCVHKHRLAKCTKCVACVSVCVNVGVDEYLKT